MTIRLFVTSAALMIFSWLAATYLRAVPMDTYPMAPAVTRAPLQGPASAVAASEEKAPVRLISTTAPR